MKPMVFLALLVCCLHSTESAALTIEEAYAAIPHQRTVFDRSASRLSKAQVEGLLQLFALTDRGTVLRVEAMRAFRGGQLQDFRAALDRYRTLIEALRSLNLPGELMPAHALIVQSVQGHQRFFEASLKASDSLARRELVFTTEVHESSRKLRQAYDLLMKMYSNEPGVNKSAFFDYLCALDFL